MALIQTSNDLKAQGWTFDNHSVCNRCGDDIEWWKSRSGKPLAYNSMPTQTSPAIPHYKVCN